MPSAFGRGSYGRASDAAADFDTLCASSAFRKEVHQLKSAQDDLELSLVDQRNRIIADAERRLKGLETGCVLVVAPRALTSPRTSATDAIRRKTIGTERVKALQAFDVSALEQFDLLRRKQVNTLLQLGVPEPIEADTVARLAKILDDGDA